MLATNKIKAPIDVGFIHLYAKVEWSNPSNLSAKRISKLLHILGQREHFWHSARIGVHDARIAAHADA